MPSTTHDHAAYDENLLAAAPAATKAQLQSGYTTDLLDGKSGVAHPARRRGDVESGNAYAEKTATTGTSSPAHTPVAPVPFYRTTKGRIIIAVGILIVLGAIIGGAVGGTRNSKKSDNGQSNGAAASQSVEPTQSADPSQQASNINASSPTASSTAGNGIVPGFSGLLPATTSVASSTSVVQGTQPGPPVGASPTASQVQEIAHQR